MEKELDENRIIHKYRSKRTRNFHARTDRDGREILDALDVNA